MRVVAIVLASVVLLASCNLIKTEAAQLPQPFCEITTVDIRDAEPIYWRVTCRHYATGNTHAYFAIREWILFRFESDVVAVDPTTGQTLVIDPYGIRELKPPKKSAVN